jgi:hypothetical protein
MPRWAFVAAAVLVVAGCSQDAGSPAAPAKPSSSTPRAAGAQPAAGAPVSEVIAWIAAGEAADPSGFQTVTDGYHTTQIAPDASFVTPAPTGSDHTSCITNSKYDATRGRLTCTVNFTNPPTPPPGVEQFRGRWVVYDGLSVQVGSQHGDAGVFGQGVGPELSYGKSLKFGDYQCRVEQAGVYCANIPHQTAVKLSEAGVETFGCLASVTPPPNIGLEWRCP